MLKLIKKNKYNLISFVCIFIYIFIYSHIGFSVDDGGYMYGAGWRLLNGEVLYLDYIYARPPLSPLISALLQFLLPDNYEYLYTRIFYYFEIFTYSYLSIVIIKKIINIKREHILVLSTITFMINAHFNNYLWHTVDGIFFAAISLYFLVNKKYTISVIFLIFSCMTKQSFYPLFFIYPLIVYMNDSKMFFLKYVFKEILFVFLVVFSWYLLYSNSFTAFIDLKQSKSQIAPFLKSGFIVYIFHFLLFFILFMILSILKFEKLKKKSFIRKYLILKSFFLKTNLYILFFTIIGLFFIDIPFAKIFHMQITFIMLLVFIDEFIVFYLKRNKQRFSLILGLFFIAWSASLSWGYQTPIFFIGVFFILYFYKNKHILKRFDLIILRSTIILFFILVPWIISERGLFDLKSISFFGEKLNGIYVKNDDKFENMKKINNKIEGCIKSNEKWEVFPDFTFIKYVKNDKSYISLDWISNVEAMNKTNKIEKQIHNVDCLILNHNYRFKNKKEEFDWDYKPEGY